MLAGQSSPATRVANPSPQDNSPNAVLSRGMQTLLKTSSAVPFELQSELAVVESPITVQRPAEGIPAWFFWGLDLLLVTVAIVLVAMPHGPVTRWRMVTATVMLAAAAISGVLPMLRMAQTDRKDSHDGAKWVLCHSLSPSDPPFRRFVVRTVAPQFIGEIRIAEGGRLEVIPLMVNRTFGGPPVFPDQLAAEAIAFCLGTTEFRQYAGRDSKAQGNLL